ncbi:MAG: inositol monophosphatase family protein [Actinomycetes bacterium]|jgi:myo-inositol-1(or 4)-monophosphatase|nr:MAG: inositol monophosphatase [Actinomycetota bacterium]
MTVPPAHPPSGAPADPRPESASGSASGPAVPPQSLPELLGVATEALRIARRIVRSRLPGAIRAKGDRDLVTDIDLAVEEAVREFLARETPHIGFLGEEHGRVGPGGDAPWWTLDPVDGTSNLSRGIPLCGVSLALVSGRDAVLAAIDLPFLEVGFTAAAGQGAYLDGERIHVAETREPSDAVVSIGDFAVGPGAEHNNRVRLNLLAALGARVHRVRMLGSAAIDLAWVAQGKLDASIILSNLPWDTMAGVLLVREAGGAVLDRDGGDHTVDSAITVAVCPGLREYVMATLADAYAKAARG